MESDHVAVLLEDLKSTIQTVAEGVVMANEHLARHDHRFDQHDERLDRLDVRMGRLEGRMERVEGRMERVEEAVLDLAKDVRILKQATPGEPSARLQ
jgi:chromosome segregation ATPase